MKNIVLKLSPIAVWLLMSCNWAAVDLEKAKAVAENLMKDMQSGDYSRMDQYYTASFNESEPLEKKTEKYRKLNATLGEVQSFEFIDAKEDKTSDHGGPKIELRYRMKCSRVTVTHTVVVINDEGEHKIAFQNFEN